MSGDGGDCGGHGGGDGCAMGHAADATPISGNSYGAAVGVAPVVPMPVVNGVEINRAAILETAHEKVIRRTRDAGLQ